MGRYGQTSLWYKTPSSHQQVQSKMDSVNSVTLASQLAKHSRSLKNAIHSTLLQYLEQPSDEPEPELVVLYQQTQKLFHLPSVDNEGIDIFADLFGQTVTYVLFINRLANIASDGAALNPVLTLIKSFLAVKSHAAQEKILSIKRALQCINTNPSPKRNTQSQIIHFYEEYLHHYQRKTRKTKGVYYTPDAVVGFIIRSIDTQLTEQFDLPMGIASTKTWKQVAQKTGISIPSGITDETPFVQILDPATGTGTFIRHLIVYIREKQKSKWREQRLSKEQMTQRWAKYLRGKNGLLNRIVGMELLPTPCIIAHLQLGMVLQDDLPFVFTEQDRLHLYSTNALTSTANHQVLGNRPFTVIIGNPPYAGSSKNIDEWIMTLMKDYKVEPGGSERLKERNPKWINDDYVKFIRLAQWHIERTTVGVIGFVTPHGYLDNPTFRGVRWRLWTTFDNIYLFDLHGNARKKESHKPGRRDENVFAIMQGVAVGLFSKSTTEKKGNYGKVYHGEIYGTKLQKTKALEKHEVQTIAKQSLPVLLDQLPYLFMKPLNVSEILPYTNGFSIAEATHNTVGIVTGRDNLVIAFTKEELIQQMQTHLGKNASNTDLDESRIKTITYRPFDQRFIYYDDVWVERTRKKVMTHFHTSNNLGFIFKRGHTTPQAPPMFITNHAIEFRSWSRPGMQGGDYVSPMYLRHVDSQNTTLNLTLETKSRLLRYAKSEQQIFDYIYGIVHHPSYQTLFADLLAHDFPRIPYPKTQDRFTSYASLGEQLRSFHLLQHPEFEKVSSNLQRPTGESCSQSNQINIIRREGRKVWINDNEFFVGVSEVAWEAYIGGYQPAQKWLKDRMGRQLSTQEVIHYHKIIIALEKTTALRNKFAAVQPI